MHAGIPALLGSGIVLYGCVALLWPKLAPEP
jgi:hypothetical protein